MRAVVQTSRLVRHSCVKGARRARSARALVWACCTTWAASSRSRRWRFPPRKGKGTIRFNDTAGSMAKDSVFNATSVLRASRHRHRRFRSAHQYRWRRQHRRSVGRFGHLFGAVFGGDENADAARCCGYRRTFDSGQGSRGRRIVEKLYAARQAGMRRVLFPKRTRARSNGAYRARSRSGDQRRASDARPPERAAPLSTATVPRRLAHSAH